ncbi:MAG: hypothetical protein M1832_006322 [Thelocarpon impressellum]|nr:MAG: hypothetical protein M1832_006322 [Thelocarpon impressellum]
MSSITIKISSLVIRTLSKPIANQIKAQAREHARFRRFCVAFAQSLHRIDMRLRLGLLRDPAAIERQVAREAAEAQAKKQKLETPTVKTEAQTRADEAAAAKDKDKPRSSGSKQPRIRPLPEAKAIDMGANFISETFLFLVGGSLIVFESFRSRRKENSRREDIADRLEELEESERNARRGMVALEKEILRLRAEEKRGVARQHGVRILPKEVWEEEADEADEADEGRGWFAWIRGQSAQKISPNDEPSAVKQGSPPPSDEKPAVPPPISSSDSKPTLAKQIS